MNLEIFLSFSDLPSPLVEQVGGLHTIVRNLIRWSEWAGCISDQSGSYGRMLAWMEGVRDGGDA